MMEFIHIHYNAFHGVIHLLVADLRPVVALVGACGIFLIIIDPGQHAQRIENGIVYWLLVWLR